MPTNVNKDNGSLYLAHFFEPRSPRIALLVKMTDQIHFRVLRTYMKFVK